MSDFPSGWKSAELRDIIGADGLFADGDWIESKDQDANGNIRLLQLADIGDGHFLNKSARFINEKTFSALRCTQLKKGDVLVARMPDPLGRACLMPELPQRCVTVVDVAAIRPGSDDVCNQWLVRAINSPQVRHEIEIRSSGTTRKRISRGNLGAIRLGVPPVTEQTRIADKLDTVLARVDACRDRLARVAPLLKRFRQSVLAAATSGRLTEEWRITRDMTAEWPMVLLPHMCLRITDGEHISPARADGGIPLLTAKNVTEHGLAFDDVHYVSQEDADKFWARCRPERGDILVCSRGTIGRSLLVGDVRSFCLMGTVILIKPDVAKVIPAYMAAVIASPAAQQKLKSASGATAVSALYLRDIKALSFRVPPSEEQTEIVRRVESLLAFADRLEARLTQARTAADRLTPALLAKAFRGELVPQDPNDEPAAELLRRLAAQRAQDATPTRRPRRKETA